MDLFEKTRKISPSLFPGKAEEDTVGRNEVPSPTDIEFPELRKIGLEVAHFYNMNLWQIHEPTKTRKREIVQTRQIAMFFARIFTKHSLATIGAYFSGKDHATVRHAVITVNNLIDTDRKIREDIHQLYRILKKELGKDDFDGPYYITESPETYEVHIAISPAFYYGDFKELAQDLIEMNLPENYKIVIL